MERNWIVVRTHVTKRLTQEEAYLMALRLRSQGYATEMVTNDEWAEQNRDDLQDLTPLEPESVKGRRVRPAGRMK